MRCRLEGGRELIELPKGQYLLRTPWDGFNTALAQFPKSIQEAFYSSEEVLFWRRQATAPIVATYYLRHYPSMSDCLFDLPDQKGLETIIYDPCDEQEPRIAFRTAPLGPNKRPSMILYPNFRKRDSFMDMYSPFVKAKLIDIFCPRKSSSH